MSFGSGRPAIEGSEKNCYIDADIGDVWEKYRSLVKEVRFDKKSHGIGNVKWVAGEDSIIRGTSMRYVFLLRRDPSDDRKVYPMTFEEALRYLSKGFCNSHQIICDIRHSNLRKEFFRRYLSEYEIHMVNTPCTAEETHENIRNVLRGRCGI